VRDRDSKENSFYVSKEQFDAGVKDGSITADGARTVATMADSQQRNQNRGANPLEVVGPGAGPALVVPGAGARAEQHMRQSPWATTELAFGEKSAVISSLAKPEKPGDEAERRLLADGYTPKDIDTVLGEDGASYEGGTGQKKYELARSHFNSSGIYPQGGAAPPARLLERVAVGIPAPSQQFEVARFSNPGNHCYRNAAYSVFLNNNQLRAAILEKFPADFVPGDGHTNEFIKCLQKICLHGGVHPIGVVPNRQSRGPLDQINTAMYNFLEVAPGKEKYDLDNYFSTDKEEGMSNEGQHDSGEFIQYFSIALSLLGINVCEYVEFRTRKAIGNELYWNKRDDQMDPLTISPVDEKSEGYTAQLTTVNLALNKKGSDNQEVNWEKQGTSIFQKYAEIFMERSENYTIAVEPPIVKYPNPINNIRAPFDAPPLFICLSNNRTTLDDYGNQKKDNSFYPIEEEIKIPIISQDQQTNALSLTYHNYTCCGVAFHRGPSPTFGHYVSCVKSGDGWHFLNDAHPPKAVTWRNFKDDNLSDADGRYTIVTATYEHIGPVSEARPLP